MTTRWLFGDQLGPHFLDDHDGPVVMVESRAVFARRRFHRAKAHLVLSAMRHRAAELGDRVDHRRADTYAEVVGELSQVEVVHPTSYAALGLVRRLGADVLEPRGFATSREDFTRWAERRGGRRLLMEDFYREAGGGTTCSWTPVSPLVGSGTSTTTTASRRPRARRLSV